MPVNFLDPRPGTPLAIRKPVRPLDAIRWIAMFRLGLPDVILRYAGGRELTLGELQAMGMTAGINALIVGNYLTTLGPEPRRRPHHAPRPPHANRGALQGHLSALDPSRHCTGCGQGRVPSAPPADGARASTKPPRYCPTCGRGLRVLITPTAWTARCRDHGSVNGAEG